MKNVMIPAPNASVQLFMIHHELDIAQAMNTNDINSYTCS